MEIFISVMLLFAGIAVLIAIHVCISGRVLRRENNQGDHHNHNHNIDTISNENKIMSKDDLKGLPCFEYKVAEKENTSSVDCAVCLENFKMGDKCRLLPNCKHSFHVQCIDSWVLKTPDCPICRTCVNPTLKIEVVWREESSISGNVWHRIKVRPFVQLKCAYLLLQLLILLSDLFRFVWDSGPESGIHVYICPFKQNTWHKYGLKRSHSKRK